MLSVAIKSAIKSLNRAKANIMKFQKTNYKGVSWRDKTNLSTGKEEKIFYIRYYAPNGQEHFEKVGSSREEMSAYKASQIRARRSEGKETSNQQRRLLEEERRAEAENRWPFDRLWDHYRQNRENYKGESRDGRVYRCHIQPVFGDKEPHDLHPFEIDRLKQTLYKKKGLKDQTVKNILELIRRLANWGRKRKVTSGLGFELEMPKPNNVVKEVLPPQLIGNLLEALDRAEDQLEASFIRMCLFTGRRTGEICKLRWEDVDLDQQSMFLRNTKTNKDELLPLADALVKMLRNMPRWHEEWVFPNHNGEERKRLDLPGKRIIREAGIPASFRPTYSLRHTFASEAASIGIPWHIIKELLGHKNANRDITDRYAHVSHRALLAAVNQVVEALELERPGKERSNIIDFPKP